MLQIVREGNGMFQMGVEVESNDTRIGLVFHLFNTWVKAADIALRFSINFFSSCLVNHVSCKDPGGDYGEHPEEPLHGFSPRLSQIL